VAGYNLLTSGLLGENGEVLTEELNTHLERCVIQMNSLGDVLESLVGPSAPVAQQIQASSQFHS
jgi:hypothetical protein